MSRQKMSLLILALLIMSVNLFSQDAILYPHLLNADDHFGIDCDMSENFFLVGTDMPGTILRRECAWLFNMTGEGDTVITALYSNDYQGDFYDQGFGYAVAMDSGHIVVGAYRDSVGWKTYAGSAYIFARTSSGQYESNGVRIFADDIVQYQEFGMSVDVSGDYVIVGAPNTFIAGGGDFSRMDGNRKALSKKSINPAESHLLGIGAAYVFKLENGNWNLQAKLQANDGESIDGFGWSVAIEDSIAVVGAKNAIIDLQRKGAVYVFRRYGETWVQKAKLYINDGQRINWLGKSVGLSGDYVIAGADGDYYDNPCKGRAFVFKKPEQGWRDMTDTEAIELIAPEIEVLDHYGKSVVIQDSTAAVCSPFDEQEPDQIGTVSLFKKGSGQWNFVQKYYSSKLSTPDGFVNKGIAMSQPSVLVGAAAQDQESGVTFVFDHDSTTNIFRGIGDWSHKSHWSVGRIPQDNDAVIIRGHCTVDVAIPATLAQFTVDTTFTHLPNNLVELGLPHGLASIDLQGFQLPSFASIENRGIILTQNNSTTPLPSDRNWGGWIVFNSRSWLPVLKQAIPRGVYKNILLTGNKKVDAIDLVQVEQMCIKNGAHLKLDNGDIEVLPMVTHL